MSKSSSIQSYPHCKEIWDAAYASPTGSVLIRPKDPDRINMLVGDLLHYRVLIRKDNAKFYPEGHPQHMTSIFDPFTVTKLRIDGLDCIRIRKRVATDFQIDVEEIE